LVGHEKGHMVCKSLAVAIPKVTLRNRDAKIDFLDYRYGGVVGVEDIALVLCHGHWPASQQGGSVSQQQRPKLTDKPKCRNMSTHKRI